jgi:hypothetical protein
MVSNEGGTWVGGKTLVNYYADELIRYSDRTFLSPSSSHIHSTHFENVSNLYFFNATFCFLYANAYDNDSAQFMGGKDAHQQHLAP